MSAIRDRILRGEPATGTAAEATEWLVESIATWTEEQKRECREIMLATLKRWQDARLIAMPCSDSVN